MLRYVPKNAGNVPALPVLARAANGLTAIPFRVAARGFTPVLTYHATYQRIPDSVDAVDNVTPECLYQQLSEMQRHYRFVSIDELCEARSLGGLSSVTFDDGYKCVIDEALPVFEALNIPFTVFLNTSSFDHKPFWRHKVVYIINHNLVEECERHLQRVKALPGRSFHAYLKHSTNNSRIVEAEIDGFLERKQIKFDACGYLFDSESYLIDHPLVWYGNHSRNHYVLSSLPFEEQVREIDSVKRFLEQRRHLQVSQVFSLPFGEAEHVNGNTFTALRELGYRSLAMNRGRLTHGRAVKQGIRIIERFSPAETSISWQHKKTFLKMAAARRDVALDRPGGTGNGMRILELLDTLDTGGAERMASSLALKMQAEGNSVHIVCLREKGAMPVSEDRFDRAGVALLEYRKTDGFSPRAVLRLAGYLRKHKIEVVHSHNPLVHHYAVAAARLAGVPAVVNTLHGIDTLRMPKWAQALFRASCALGHGVVHVSGAVKDAFSREVLELGERSLVIRNGIELGDLVKITPRRLDGLFVFGSIGRLAPVKDQRSLLTAFSRVHSEFPHCRLEILGSGELEAELKQLAVDLGIAAEVTFHGWSPDIAAFLRRWDVFALSSRSEGLPLTLLEAMAAGLPVVATAVGGIPELVNRSRAGWLCPPRDPEKLAAQMRNALLADDLREKGNHARQDVLAHHSVEQMTREYLNLFSRILQSRGHKK
jgi:glycosyltransferase involved in cell wall biosynthesis/peptidoglycan/xylan/chitin deacetylase (PgdA/CDA1 family)